MKDQISLTRQYIDAPEPIIQLALVDAMRDFCQRSDAWVEVFRTAVKEGALSYFLVLPYLSELVAVTSVEGALGGWHSDGIDRLILSRKPSSKTLTVTMRLKPKLGTTEIPKPLTIYRDALRAATLARLYSQQGTDWHNPDEAMRWQQEYAGFLGDARIAQAQRHADATAQMRAPIGHRWGGRNRRIW